MTYDCLKKGEGTSESAFFRVAISLFIFMRGICYVFVIIGCAMATALTSIEQDFKMEISQNAIGSKNIWQLKMIKLQRCYDCISLVVNRLHTKFEWIFMSQVTDAFIFATHSTWNLLSHTNFESGTDIFKYLRSNLRIIEPFIRLGLITYTVDCIKNKVKLVLWDVTYAFKFTYIAFYLQMMNLIQTINRLETDDILINSHINLQRMRQVLIYNCNIPCISCLHWVTYFFYWIALGGYANDYHAATFWSIGFIWIEQKKFTAGKYTFRQIYISSS